MLILSLRPALAHALATHFSTTLESTRVLPPDRWREKGASEQIVYDSVHLPRALTGFQAMMSATNSPVIYLAARPSDFLASSVRRAGAKAVVSDHDDLSVWAKVIPQLNRLPFQLGPSFVTAPKFEHLLTERESEIYDLVLQGYTDMQAAETLGISLLTAETHRRNLQRKLACGSHLALLSHAIEHGALSACDVALRMRHRQATRQHG